MPKNTEDAELYSAEAERSILGCIMLEGLAGLEKCIDVQPHHFFLVSHREIYAAIRKALESTQILDALVLRSYLGGKLDSVGGVSYLSELTEGIYRNFDPAQRIEVVIEFWRRRETAKICEKYSIELADSSPDYGAIELISSMQLDLMDLMQDQQQDDPHVSAYSHEEFDRFRDEAYGEGPDGLSYGCPMLDDWTGGMKPGRVTVVGARSGVGKSSMMKQAAVANAKAGIPTTLFSLEMTRGEILRGLWAIESGIPYRKLERPKESTPFEREHLQAAMGRIRDWPLRIYDRADMKIDQIVAFARMNVRQYGTKFIAVDYAQSVEADEKDERMKVASVSRKLTKMAKMSGCSLMLLSQLRKVPIEQYNKAPTAADLRETGQLENDAHVIVLLHRGWDEDHNQISEDAAILIPKFRNGRTGAMEARFNPKSLTFEAAK